MTQRRLSALVLATLALLGTVVGWRLLHPRRAADVVTLSGNIDLRQVELAFNDSDRIASVLVQEGDRLSKGQVVARLDVSRLRPEVAQLEAQADAQAAVVQKMHAGNRPQEIAQAKDALTAERANAVNARGLYQRAASLWDAASGQAAVSRQDVDNAKSAMDASDARLAGAQEAYDLAVAGYRREDIIQAEAQLRATRAQLEVLRRELIDADLASPVTGVVRARLMEPGEMASPQRPVFTISETSPKWVRAYLHETDLPRVHPGMRASVTVDGFPGRSYRGWVGFISSVAEFTPKTVETTELRSSLVYEIRTFVNDPSDDLRLGMPATVRIQVSGPVSGRR